MIYKNINTRCIGKIINEYTNSLIDPIPFKTYQGVIWTMKMAGEWNGGTMGTSMILCFSLKILYDTY